MAELHLEFVSPESVLFSGDVDQVDLPGAEGDMGILAGHAPPVTTTASRAPPRKIVTTPGRSVVTSGAWPARMPMSPSAPGRSTWSTSPENSTLSGETNSR